MAFVGVSAGGVLVPQTNSDFEPYHRRLAEARTYVTTLANDR